MDVILRIAQVALWGKGILWAKEYILLQLSAISAIRRRISRKQDGVGTSCGFEAYPKNVVRGCHPLSSKNSTTT